MTTDCSTQSAYYGYADNIAAVVISEAEISRRALPILVFVTRNVGDVQRADMRLLNPGSPLPDVRRLRRQNLRDAVAIGGGPELRESGGELGRIEDVVHAVPRHEL